MSLLDIDGIDVKVMWHTQVLPSSLSLLFICCGKVILYQCIHHSKDKEPGGEREMDEIFFFNLCCKQTSSHYVLPSAEK